MKLQTRMLSMVAFLVLAIPMIAGAVPVGTFSSELNPAGQTFYGDGAAYGDGFLQAPPANPAGDKCLECHQGQGSAPDKTSYLRTGHGNMVLKVTSPPQQWRGPEGDLYKRTNPFGHPIDWTTGKVDLGGQCDIGGFEGQFSQEDCEDTTACTLAKNDFLSPAYTKATCEAGGGTWKKGHWTPGTRLADITFLVGPWMSIDQPDTGITGAGLPPNKFMMADGRQYGTCGSCHNAGYKANDYTRPQPFADYPNYPRSAAAGIGGSWVLDGIQCERCHDATQHYAAPFTATAARGASSTALCSQCHIRPAGWEGSANPNASTQPTAYPIGASATNFGGHLIGKQFLNSPHGKFTGAYAQIATKLDLYNSRFSDGTRQGGCDTCHDVHQSTIVKIYPFDYPDDFALASSLATPLAVSGTPVPIRRECVVCHIDKEDLATIRHPGGVGTPQGDGSNVADACKSCHMPKPPLGGGALGLYVHVMRINTDPNYSTFPKAGATTPGICSDPYYKTRAACIANGKSWSLVANSAPDGNFTEAVWVDLGLACGKCHFEGGGAIVMTKRQLAQYAKGIHGAGGNTNLPPIASGVESATVSNLTVTFVDKSFDDSSFAKTDIMDPNYNLRIAVSWGDGTIDTGLAGSTFQHTYRSAGAKTIRQTATDTGGLKGFKRVTVNVGQ